MLVNIKALKLRNYTNTTLGFNGAVKSSSKGGAVTHLK